MPSSSPSKAASACPSRRPRAAGSQDHPILEQRRVGDRLRGLRYRHRNSAGEAAHHLRGLSAGRCRHQPQVRRNRTGTRHQPRTGQSARRRNPIDAARPATAARSRSTCRRPMLAHRLLAVPDRVFSGAAGTNRQADRLGRADRGDSRRSGKSRSPRTMRFC